ncbi:IS66 family insertion sequence element accessory protein TnpB
MGIKDETDALPALTAYLRWQWLYSVVRYKTLEDQGFCWPGISAARIRLDHSQLMALLAGMDWKKIRPAKVRRPLLTG